MLKALTEWLMDQGEAAMKGRRCWRLSESPGSVLEGRDQKPGILGKVGNRILTVERKG